MPTFHVEMFDGRTAEQKKALVEKVTQAACDALGCKPETVSIIITDIKKENWASGGKLWSEPR